MLTKLKDLNGYSLQSQDGAIGNINDCIIDGQTWGIQYLEVDTRNWIPGRTVLISSIWIAQVSWDDSKVSVNLIKEIIKDSPEYSEEVLLTREYETQLHGHYKRVGDQMAGQKGVMK